MEQYIDKKILRTMVPLSYRTIDAREKAGEFPKRFALSARKVVWDKADVVAWMSDQKAAGKKANIPQGCLSRTQQSPSINHI